MGIPQLGEFGERLLPLQTGSQIFRELLLVTVAQMRD